MKIGVLLSVVLLVAVLVSGVVAPGSKSNKKTSKSKSKATSKQKSKQKQIFCYSECYKWVTKYESSSTYLNAYLAKFPRTAKNLPVCTSSNYGSCPSGKKCMAIKRHVWSCDLSSANVDAAVHTEYMCADECAAKPAMAATNTDMGSFQSCRTNVTTTCAASSVSAGIGLFVGVVLLAIKNYR